MLATVDLPASHRSVLRARMDARSSQPLHAAGGLTREGSPLLERERIDESSVPMRRCEMWFGRFDSRRPASHKLIHALCLRPAPAPAPRSVVRPAPGAGPRDRPGGLRPLLLARQFPSWPTWPAFRKVRHVSAGTYGLLFDTAAGDILRMGQPATAAGGAEGAPHADQLGARGSADLERHVQRDARRRRSQRRRVPRRRRQEHPGQLVDGGRFMHRIGIPEVGYSSAPISLAPSSSRPCRATSL